MKDAASFAASAIRLPTGHWRNPDVKATLRPGELYAPIEELLKTSLNFKPQVSAAVQRQKDARDALEVPPLLSIIYMADGGVSAW